MLHTGKTHVGFWPTAAGRGRDAGICEAACGCNHGCSPGVAQMALLELRESGPKTGKPTMTPTARPTVGLKLNWA